MTKIKICMDMDGVLADFTRGAFRLHGKSLPMKDVRWDFVEQLGIHPAEFWGRMGREFWAGLDPIPTGLLLLREAKKLVGAENICILTSPCRTAGCYEGKRDWIENYLPEYIGRFFAAPSLTKEKGSGKQFFAAENVILIDDHDKNLQAWRQAGGETVAYPQPWNYCRDAVDDNGEVDPESVLRQLRYIVKNMELYLARTV